MEFTNNSSKNYIDNDPTYPSIKDIPISDIRNFLAENNVYPKKDKTAYECAKRFMFHKKYINTITTIKNWKLACTIKDVESIKTYNISFMIRMSDNEIISILEQYLQHEDYQTINRNDTIQILGYLHKLIDDFSLLPDELISKILEYINYEDLQSLYKTNKKFYNLYHSKSFNQQLKTIKHNYHTSRFLLSKMNEDLLTTKFVVFDRLNINLIIIMEQTSLEYKFLENERFIDIMWLIGIKIKYIQYINDKEDLIEFLSNKGNLSTDTLDIKGNINSWSLDKLNYYYNIYLRKQKQNNYNVYSKTQYILSGKALGQQILGQQILDRMIELNQQ